MIGRLVVAGALAVGLAGCGSASEGADTRASAEPPLAVAAFKSQANALCETANAELKAIQSTVSSATTEAAANVVVGKMADRVDKLVKDIDALREPADLATGVNALLDTVRTVSSALHTQGLAYVQAHPDPFGVADAKALAIGLPQCAGAGQ